MYIEVGKIANTHGLKGELKIISWCDFPEMFEDFPKVLVDNKEYDVLSVRFHKENVLLMLSGIDSPEKAEALKNKVIMADRTYFSLPEGRFFIADLIGLEVREEDNLIGKIKEIIPTGSTNVYVVTREGKQDLLFPANDTTVLKTDVSGGYVKVKLPEGLEEL